MSTTKTALMDTMQLKINEARANLSIGWHNPDVMEDIEHLYKTLKCVEKFELNLYLDNMDID